MKKILLLFFLLSCCVMYGQISTAELPYSWDDERNIIPLSSIPVKTMPHLDFEALQKEDLENAGVGPYRFGYSHTVNLTLENSGLWTTTEDGGKLWRLRIASPDARSLNLLYDKFWLPEGAKFFLYSEDKKQHLGAFTSRNNKGTKEDIKGFATTFLFAKTIVLEYYEPANITENGILSVSRIISGYRNIYDSSNSKIFADGPGYDPNCFVDVNCHPDWHQGKKDAVALIIFGVHACSGALLNTTAHDNRPVFLTANHCFEETVSLEDYIFHWNFEAEIECDTTINYTYPDPLKTTKGARLLAKREDTDFMLLELDVDPATNYYVKPYYLGWERTLFSSPVGFCIHHPLGLPKMITLIMDKILIFGEPYYLSPPYSLWWINIHKGIFLDGSSGSPLMNVNRRVIGQLLGGAPPMCPPKMGILIGPSLVVLTFLGMAVIVAKD